MQTNLAAASRNKPESGWAIDSAVNAVSSSAFVAFRKVPKQPTFVRRGAGCESAVGTSDLSKRRHVSEARRITSLSESAVENVKTWRFENPYAVVVSTRPSSVVSACTSDAVSYLANNLTDDRSSDPHRSTLRWEATANGVLESLRVLGMRTSFQRLRDCHWHPCFPQVK